MKTNLGISIYPEKIDIESTLKYIDLSYKYGFTRIFSNLLEFKNNKEGNKKLSTLSKIYEYAKNKGFEVIVDVDQFFYNEFHLSKDSIDFFLHLNVSGIRLDVDLGGKIEAKISNNSNNFKIEINASSGTKIIDNILDYGGNPKNLIACHNFYPMKFTGLSEMRFYELSSYFKAKGIRIKAFITLPREQKSIGPWKINEGMPTLERHRNISISKQVEDFLSMNIVDDIIIAQQGVSEDQFKKINEVINRVNRLIKKTIELSMTFFGNSIEEDIIFNNKNEQHFNRADYNDFFIRSTIPRLSYKLDMIKPSNCGKDLEVGDIVILNENIGCYKGELHIIIKKHTDYNNSKNLVGRIKEKDIWKLKYIKGETKFKFIKN